MVGVVHTKGFQQRRLAIKLTTRLLEETELPVKIITPPTKLSKMIRVAKREGCSEVVIVYRTSVLIRSLETESEVDTPSFEDLKNILNKYYEKRGAKLSG